MHRTQVLIEDWQYQTLRSMAERQGGSISELLREILDSHLVGRRRARRQRLRRILGIGSDRGTSGRDHDRILYEGKRRR